MHHEKERITWICVADIARTHLAGLGKLGLTLLPGLFVLLALLEESLRDFDVLYHSQNLVKPDGIHGHD